MKNRREFLATVGAVGAASILSGSGRARGSLAAEGQQKLAIDGGTPVRKNALGSKPYGPQFYDDVEKQELIDVLESKSPFRWWGGKSKVLQFEEAYAAHIGVKHALGVTSGTTALFTAMAALTLATVGVGAAAVYSAGTVAVDVQPDDGANLSLGMPAILLHLAIALTPDEVIADFAHELEPVWPTVQAAAREKSPSMLCQHVRA